MTLLRAPKLMALLRNGPPTAPRWSRHLDMTRATLSLVQAFYLFTVFHLASNLRSLTRLPTVDLDGFDPLWPVRWIEVTGASFAAHLLSLAAVATAVLAAFQWHRRWVRVLVALVILQIGALQNSWGSMSHGTHEWFWIAALFVFLPDASKDDILRSRVLRVQVLNTFAGAMALILLFYTMSGYYKVFDAVVHLIRGEFSGFSPAAMAHTLAWRTMQTDTTPLLAGYIIDNPVLGWPLYVGLYYIELVAIMIFFRPSLHRAWGVLLMLFHFGTILFMDIPFPTHVLFCAMLFVLSPFAPEKEDLGRSLSDLPMLGWMFARGRRAEVRTRDVTAP